MAQWLSGTIRWEQPGEGHGIERGPLASGCESVLEQSTPLALGLMARRPELINSHPFQVEIVLSLRRVTGEPFIALRQVSLLPMTLWVLASF